jgi:hypothetical protein
MIHRPLYIDSEGITHGGTAAFFVSFIIIVGSRPGSLQCFVDFSRVDTQSLTFKSNCIGYCEEFLYESCTLFVRHLRVKMEQS